jgi:hypothetical protein
MRVGCIVSCINDRGRRHCAIRVGRAVVGIQDGMHRGMGIVRRVWANLVSAISLLSVSLACAFFCVLFYVVRPFSFRPYFVPTTSISGLSTFSFLGRPRWLSRSSTKHVHVPDERVLLLSFISVLTLFPHLRGGTCDLRNGANGSEIASVSGASFRCTRTSHSFPSSWCT